MNTLTTSPKKDTLYLVIIGILSVAIPVVVAILFYLPQAGKLGNFDVSFLPHLNAALNSATAICLVMGYTFIKRKQQRYHITAMITAFALSSLFLVSYVIYHYQGTHTTYPTDAGTIRYFYLFILLTHILLAII